MQMHSFQSLVGASYLRHLFANRKKKPTSPHVEPGSIIRHLPPPSLIFISTRACTDKTTDKHLFVTNLTHSPHNFNLLTSFFLNLLPTRSPARRGAVIRPRRDEVWGHEAFDTHRTQVMGAILKMRHYSHDTLHARLQSVRTLVAFLSLIYVRSRAYSLR